MNEEFLEFILNFLGILQEFRLVNCLTGVFLFKKVRNFMFFIKKRFPGRAGEYRNVVLLFPLYSGNQLRILFMTNLILTFLINCSSLSYNICWNLFNVRVAGQIISLKPVANKLLVVTCRTSANFVFRSIPETA